MKKIILVICLCAMTLSEGCGYEMETAIHSDLSYQVTNHVYYTEEESEEFAEEYSASLEKELKENGFSYSGKEVINGIEMYHYTNEQGMGSGAAGMDTFIVNEKNRNVISTAEHTAVYAKSGAARMDNDWTEYVKAVYSITYPFPVYATNGELQENRHTVRYDLTQMAESMPRGWAVASPAVKNCSKVAVKGAKKNGTYKKPVNLQLVTKGVITEFTVNGENMGADSAYLREEGKYAVKYKTASGKSGKIKFCIDQTAPFTNIKNNKIYKKVTIHFGDKLSGVKTATLNGKKIKSGKTVTKAGMYTLKITDRAGNRMIRKFKINTGLLFSGQYL